MSDKATPVKVLRTDMPGLFNVMMSDGTCRYDLTLGQVRSIGADNLTVEGRRPNWRREPPWGGGSHG